MSASGKYETVIGLEVHAQLLTATKIFCSCSTSFGSAPNTQVCPVCLGLPGVLPVLNARVAEFAFRTALGLGCDILPASQFARKNYFYPDLPKGYQISQFELPVALGGGVQVFTGGKARTIRLTRIHLEEDAGKLIHGENLGDPGASYVDLNRAGVPLLEIVSEPEMTCPEEAKDYLMSLRDILVYLEICDGNMEQGSFRCDANISLRPHGQKELGVKAEVKNMNSFRNVQKALEYEVARQERLLDEGETIVQETRLFDPHRGVTLSMRLKEEAHDYRYFPDPDLVPLEADPDWIEKIRAGLPELPAAKRSRFAAEYGIPEYDAAVLTASRDLADYFEAAAGGSTSPKDVSNWIMGELLREMKGGEGSFRECPVSPEQLASLLSLIEKGTINRKVGKAVFEEMFRTGRDAALIVEEKGLSQVGGGEELEEIIDGVLEANGDKVAAYRGGKVKLFEFFVGQVMRATKGQADPSATRELLQKKLDG
jgi:aspartyl-tRNA(Asn)/glutamyl-tRNA(Gln) amidotransferase subunit B